MHIEILNTGTELLLGTTRNTHGTWIGQELFKKGLRVQRQTTVPDGEVIETALAEIVHRADAIIITGGLGPTSDDLTREAVSRVTGIELMEDPSVIRTLENFFQQRGRVMPPSNRSQALVPVGAGVLPNPNGTAPGLYIPPRLGNEGACAFFLLPGPPRELYPMFHEEVLPRLLALARITTLGQVLELKITGIGESDLQEEIDHLLAAIPGLEYGYCARLGEVDLRLIGSPEAIAAGRTIAEKLYLADIVSDDGYSLDQTVCRLLKEKNLRIATAESCTGGLLASRITDLPGASEVFTHGFVTYSNQAKTDLLGVPENLITKHGAVSPQVAAAMATGALEKSGADFALSLTGIAGPDGGTPEKPLGTLHLGLARKNHPVQTFHEIHPRNRLDFKQTATQRALDLLRRELQRSAEPQLRPSKSFLP